MNRTVSLATPRAAHVITVELDLESVEFIADELPTGDGFTRDWKHHVLAPLLRDLDESQSSTHNTLKVVVR